MSRSLTSAAMAAIMAESTGDVWLYLLTISHATLTTPFRLVNNTQDITSRGNTYQAFPFEVSLPFESDDRPPQAQITIDNVSQLMISTLRTLADPPSVTLEVIRAADPDTVEAGPFQFMLRGVEYDAFTIRAELAFEPILDAPFPADRFTPTLYPGLFA